MEIAKRWRAEMLAELEAARAEHAAATEKLRDVTDASNDARSEQREINDAMERITRREPLAGALTVRHRTRIAELHQVSAGNLLKARGAVTNAILRLEDLENGLRQLDEVAPKRVAPIQSISEEMGEVAPA